jgi:hypothetical protein
MAVFIIQSGEMLAKENGNGATIALDSPKNSDEGVMDILRSLVMIKRIAILMAAWYILKNF